MIKNSVCAVFVIYNYGEDFYRNVKAVEKQVEKILIIDNGDGTQLSALQKNCLVSFEYILNKNINGIAGALNKALNFASENGYKYLLTMDQDSLIVDNAIGKMIQLMDCYQLKSIGPNYSNLDAKDEIILKNFIITSGNLIDVSVAVQCGGYDEKLFIDSVDLDLCLKLRLRNFNFAIARDVMMQHALGETIEGKFLFVRKKICYHNPTRQYYIFRNLHVIINRYKKHFRIYTMKLRVALFLKKAEIMFFYPKSSKKEILRKIKQGKFDAKNIK